MMTQQTTTISQAIDDYLETVLLSRSKRTFTTYRNGLRSFQETLSRHGVDSLETDVCDLPENAISWFAQDLKDLSPASERLYLTTASNLYEYLSAENLGSPNLPRIRQLIRQRARRPGVRLPQFPQDAIENLLTEVDRLALKPSQKRTDHLRNLRDRAFLICLADTGLRVHEACSLRRGDLDWQEYRAIIIGKGNREAVIRFSERSIKALKDYLSARSRLDGASGHPLSSLPLFARHDRGAGQKVLAIKTNTGRNIVTDRVREFLGQEAVGSITPHSFRHYFVTRVLQATGNLKMAQMLARHQNIAITQRYSHLSDSELDKGYWEAIEEDH